MNETMAELFGRTLEARESLFDERHESAFRLINGFTEGLPELAVDLYGRTLLIHDYSDDPIAGAQLVTSALDFYRSRLPWIETAILKSRNATKAEERNGKLLVGDSPARKIRENGVWYALDLMLNRDAGFYLDTRSLRAWEMGRLKGLRVLNAFAYTGSLGVAAMAAGAARVVQLDLNRKFLNVAKTSYTLNGFAIDKSDFLAGDFWPRISRLIRSEELFDCVIVDPPFFAETRMGIVDVERNYDRLLNKVRPLVADGGMLVAINNGVYVSGADFMATLEKLCDDGYLSVEELIPVAEDFTGYAATRTGTELTDPAPFNHSTKIAVLRVRRKDGRTV